MKKKLLTVLLALCMVVSMLPSVALAADFNDVDGHWGEAAIDRWADYGVLNGKGDGSFAPNDVMTRAEFAQMLVNMMGYSKKSGQTFNDLDPSAWYADAISKLVAAGVMKGNGAGGVNPLGQISREEAAVMLCRAFNIKPSGKGGMLFNDAGSVSSWAVDAMTALTEQGMINGTGNNILSPAGIVDRATAAQLTSNMVAEYVTSNKVLTGPIDGVVIVAKGAKVEIKDAVVTSSIVAESASVTLTNTKAQNVVVGGSSASVTADKDSSVVDVTLSGDAPKAEIKGEVAGSVTVEAGATGAAATVPQGTEVANESGNAASVNGSTVESGTTAAAPETPATPETPSTPGTPSRPSKPSTGDDTTPEKPSTSGGTGEDVKAPEVTEHKHTWLYGQLGNPAQHKMTCDDSKGGGCGEVQYGAHNWVEGRCSDCQLKKPEEETTEPKGTCKGTDAVDGAHVFAGDPVKVDATCDSNGSMTWTCQNEGCSEQKVTTIPALGHDYDAGKVTKAATCGADGTRTYTCQNDHTHTQIEAIKATGAHTWDEGKATKAATCVAVGEKTFTCKVCGKTEKKEIPIDKDAHTLVEVKAVAATCEKAGSTAGWKCSNEGCNYTTVETIEALGHNWTTGETSVCKNDKSHTCDHGETKPGEKCETCGYTVPEEEHKLTYTKGNGSHSATCSVKDCKEKDHNVTNVTCTYDQEGDTKCVCGNVKPEEHKLTYTKGNGTHSATCSVKDCKEKDHNVTNVTCTYDQEGDTKCVCGNTKPEPAKHEHNYEWNNEMGNGSHTLTCTATEGTCDAETTTEKCDAEGDDGACSVCGYKAGGGGEEGE